VFNTQQSLQNISDVEENMKSWDEWWEIGIHQKKSWSWQMIENSEDVYKEETIIGTRALDFK
jgi:hypothetical protein